MHGRYSVLAHYLKVSLKNSRLLKIPKLHPQTVRSGGFALANDSNFDRNPLRGCNYGLEGNAFLILGGAV